MVRKETKRVKLTENRALKKQGYDALESSSASSSERDASAEDMPDSESEDELVEEDDAESSEDIFESNSEEEEPDAKNSKKGDGFGTAMEAILGSRVKAHDAANPILIRNKRAAKEIDEAKSEAKARRALRVEKLQFKDRAHAPNMLPKDPDAAGQVLQHEKVLRRTAQRGVVKLLNAIHNAQVAAAGAEGDNSNAKLASAQHDEISKEKFLDMIRMG